MAEPLVVEEAVRPKKEKFRKEAAMAQFKGEMGLGLSSIGQKMLQKL